MKRLSFFLQRRTWSITAPLVAVGLTLAFFQIRGCRTSAPEAMADFPARTAPNYQALVSVKWLKGLLDYEASRFTAPRPSTYSNERFAVLEVSWATPEEAKDYHRGHIPGAVHFNTDELENGYPRWRLREGQELQRAFGRTGITPDTTVIVYGQKLIAAARVWWALKYAGVVDVRLLDGGFAAWDGAGYPVEKESRSLAPAEFAAPLATHLLATTDYVRQNLPGGHLCMADVRSTGEFMGRTSGYSYLDAKGRIPSALHAGDGEDSAFLYKQPNGLLRPPDQVLAHWQRQGMVVAMAGSKFDREVVFYCGGGWRSSVAFFHAWLLGFENIRNYSDGWSGWSTEYQPDSGVTGSTPGWKQQPTSNPNVTWEP